MATKERTGRLPLVKFATFEKDITRGEVISLQGWWKAAEECIARHGNVYGAASAYAREASKVAKKNTFDTIRAVVGDIMKLIEHGHTLGEFVRANQGIDHARSHARKYSTKKSPTKKSEPLTAKQEINKWLAPKSVAQLEYIIAQAKRELAKKK